MYRGADPTDVMGRRIGAYLLDGFISLILFGIIATVLFVTTLHSAPLSTVSCPEAGQLKRPGQAALCIEDGDQVSYMSDSDVSGLTTKVQLVGVGLSLALTVVLQGLTGATPGKFIFGLRVVNAKGANAGVGRCFLRTVLMIVDGFCAGIVGLFAAFNSVGHKRIGDKVAGTMVIGRKDRDALILARSGMALPDRRDLAAAAWSSPQAEHWTPGATPAGPGVTLPADLAGQSAGATMVAERAAQPGIDAPVWDSERDAFIQYDPALSAWMQWDDPTARWVPISQ